MSKVDSRAPSEASYFQYSGRDKLVQVTQGLSGPILGQFDYNYDGNRIRYRFSDRGNVDYFYDDGSVLVERNADDSTLLAHYQYADRLIALAQPLGKQYYHHDALGSTIGLTDAAGADKKSYRLDPWGNIRAQSGTSDNRHIFTGQEHDPNTGLVYFGARYYDPEVGRFITQDPYLGEPNTPPSLHRYLYAYSNPTVYIDLEGYKSWKDIVGGAQALVRAAAQGHKVRTEVDTAVNEYMDESRKASQERSRRIAEHMADRITQGNSLGGMAYLVGAAHVLNTPEAFEEAEAAVLEQIKQEDATFRSRTKGSAVGRVVGEVSRHGAAAATAATKVLMPKSLEEAALMGAGLGMASKGKHALTAASRDGVAKVVAKVKAGTKKALSKFGQAKEKIRSGAQKLLKDEGGWIEARVPRFAKKPRFKPSKQLESIVSGNRPRKSYRGPASRELRESGTSKTGKRKFLGEDQRGPFRIRMERAHASDPKFTGKKDPLHSVDHVHIDRRINVTSGKWRSSDKTEFPYPFKD